jgi:hypothetical protein
MRWGIGAVLATLGALVLAPAAGASTQVGNVCEGKVEATGAVLVQLENASSALPIESPAGVVTEWKVTSAVQTSQRLKVLAPTGGKDEFRVVSETDEKELVPGVNTFGARIPVPAGARFGLFSPAPSGALVCESAKSGDVLGVHPNDLIPTDAPEVFNPVSKDRVAVSAVVEPDVDGDGFGDETQDKCPQSAAFQTACPQISLDIYPVVEKSSVTLIVVADHEAPVTVSASAVIPKTSKKMKKRATSSATVAIKGGTQTTGPARLTQFKLPFPAKLKSDLKALSAKKSALLTIDATATNLVGQTTTRTTTVRLKGQAKPK